MGAVFLHDRMNSSICLAAVSGSRQVINSDILRAVTSEDGDDINYSLVKPPRLGRLIKPNQSGQFEKISQFTQTDVSVSDICVVVSVFKISYVWVSMVC